MKVKHELKKIILNFRRTRIMARKVVDVSLLSELNKGAENQEIKKGGFSKTTDVNFPVFSTPINKDIMVYIPMMNVVNTENGEEMKLLTSHNHTYREGNITNMLRCISGLEGGVYSSVLGYDGNCPACEAVKDCWTLYNFKLKAEADKLGIDPQNDTADVLKGARQKILSEMDMKGAEEYVTFPIVIIPTLEEKFIPTPDFIKNLKVQFVVWRKKRYDDNILAAMDTLMENPGHPGGRFFKWKFHYTDKDATANARDSAKNAKYTLLTDAAFLEQMSKAKPFLEKACAEFTNEKATEVIVSNQFMYREDLDQMINKIMAKTRHLNSISENGALGTPASATNSLAGFAGTLPEGNMGVETDAHFGE